MSRAPGSGPSDDAEAFHADAPLVPLEDAVEQWLRWEERANLAGFRTSVAPVEVEVCSVPRDEVEVLFTDASRRDVTDFFLRGDAVQVAKHPFNRDPSVAWFDRPAVEHWTCRFTSSRTLVVTEVEGAPLFSLKLATDRPHPDFFQPEKTRLREEATDVARWVAAIERVDALLGPPTDIALVEEVLVVLAAGRESGFLVRDLRLFQDGHHYLPALSLPFVGPQIARAHGAGFDEFWGVHYASAVGRAKAQLLGRYGLQYETPNPQNIVLQLDRRLRPTGRCVFRDLGDGNCATDTFSCREVPWTRLEHDVRPETRNSFWAFAEAAEHSVPTEVLEAWYALHDRAYFLELARLFPDAAPARAASDDPLAHWNRVLREPAGRAAVARGFERAAGAGGPSPDPRRSDG